MEGLLRVAGEPSTHIQVLLGAAVVEHHMDHNAYGDFSLDGVEEADELTAAMPLHAAAKHIAFQILEGGKKRRDAMGVISPH